MLGTAKNSVLSTIAHFRGQSRFLSRDVYCPTRAIRTGTPCPHTTEKSAFSATRDSFKSKAEVVDLEDNFRDTWENIRENTRENMRENTQENIHESTLENIRENTHENMYENTWENTRENIHERRQENM